jgi:putative ABC transport system substrate-binding protein
VKRRTFIAALGGAAAWPLAVSAQEAGRTYRIGFLTPAGRESPAVLAFLDELRLNGFIEGQNLVVDPAGFEVRREQIDERAEALVKAAPDAIIGGPELQLRALQAATRTIPLIGMSEDMVGVGLVASLARPGGNITGMSILSPELDGKRQDILIESVPHIRKLAALADSKVTPLGHVEALKEAAQRRGVELSVFGVAGSEEIVSAIDNAKASGAEALNLLATPLFSVPGSPVIKRVAELRMPAIYQWPETAEGGGFAAYGPRFTQVFRQRAQMVVKVLRGAKPADLPVEQPTKFELVINLKTAKALGLEVPTSMQLLADEVIE